MLQHVPYEREGYIADYMQDHEIAFDVVRLWEAGTLPDVSRYSALIIMGGPMGVYEEYAYKNDELALIKAAMGTIPMLRTQCYRLLDNFLSDTKRERETS